MLHGSPTKTLTTPYTCIPQRFLMHEKGVSMKTKSFEAKGGLPPNQTLHCTYQLILMLKDKS